MLDGLLVRPSFELGSCGSHISATLSFRSFDDAHPCFDLEGVSVAFFLARPSDVFVINLRCIAGEKHLAYAFACQSVSGPSWCTYLGNVDGSHVFGHA